MILSLPNKYQQKLIEDNVFRVKKLFPIQKELKKDTHLFLSNIRKIYLLQYVSELRSCY